jgi:hypothetical protein
LITEKNLLLREDILVDFLKEKLDQVTEKYLP